MDEDMSVFKSYLRRLLQDLKDLKEVLKSKDYEKAEKMVDKNTSSNSRLKRSVGTRMTSNSGLRKIVLTVINRV